MNSIDLQPNGRNLDLTSGDDNNKSILGTLAKSYDALSRKVEGVINRKERPQSGEMGDGSASGNDDKSGTVELNSDASSHSAGSNPDDDVEDDGRSKDVKWSAIDTLDDVRKMALENNESSHFPPDFELSLAKTREIHIRLLRGIRERNRRLPRQPSPGDEEYDFDLEETKKMGSSSEEPLRSENTDLEASIKNIVSKEAITTLKSAGGTESDSRTLIADRLGLGSDDSRSRRRARDRRRSTVFFGEMGQDDSYEDGIGDGDHLSKNSRVNHLPVYVSDYVEKEEDLEALIKRDDECIQSLEKAIRSSRCARGS